MGGFAAQNRARGLIKQKQAGRPLGYSRHEKRDWNLKIKLDEVSLEYTKLSESYGKLVKAIMVSIMQYLYNNLAKT